MAGRTVPSRASDAPRFVARVPFDYGTTPLDRGQVTTLAGATNDEKLTRLGYLVPLEAGATLYRCAHCGAEFIGVRERTGHGDRRHPERVRVLSPDQEDEAADREDRMLDQIAPLYTDKAQSVAGR